MNFRNGLKRGLAALGLASVSLGAAPAQQLRPTHVAKPAMWKLTDRDTTIYLFGTIHMLPKDYAWRTARFEQAVAGSQALVVETIVDEAKPEQIQAELARLAFNTPNLPPLAKRIAPEKLPLLTTALAKMGLPPNGLDKMETWAAAFILLGPQLKDLGVSGGEGVEAVLRQRFLASGKPIMQLETNGEQLSFFDTLPEAAQRELLEGTLEAPDAMREEFGGMLSAWVRGDVNAIAKSFNKSLSTTPDLKDALISRRNSNWSGWISRRMSQPGTLLVAVGAGHLAGKDSVQDMLKKSGYRVRRVQ
jgi:uncharacterized protein YbaP (TraB family)